MANNRIQEFRKSLGLTQSQLAEKLGIGRNTLQRYESSSYQGRIDAKIQEHIATTLNQPVETIFTAPPIVRRDIKRRELLSTTVGIGLLGIAGLTFSPSATVGMMLDKRKSLNAHEIQTLIEDNQATWSLLDSIQQGATIDYVNAIAQGKLVSLGYLVKSRLPEQQKSLVLTLFGDMHILVGRLNRDRQNFADAEQHFLTAMEIGDEINNPSLRAAALHRYGNMVLLDQGRLVAAVRIAEEMLEVSRQASHPIWAEAQLIAGMTFAHIGKYADAYRLAQIAREKQGTDPEIWLGNITNPKAIYADFDLVSNLAAQKYYDAYQAGSEAVKLIEQEYPDTLHWRLNVEAMQAQALWGLGDLEGAVDASITCLEKTKQIDNSATAHRVEQLYAMMLQSPNRKHPAIRRLGNALLS